MRNYFDSGKPSILQELFFRHARQGWEDLQEDTQRRITRGQSQYEYIKKLGALTTGQAQRLLDEFVNSWDHKDLDNQYLEDAVSREAVRDVWRKYYRLRAIYDMKCTRMSKPGRAPVAPNLRPDPINFLLLASSLFGRSPEFHSLSGRGVVRSGDSIL